jgi:integrase
LGVTFGGNSLAQKELPPKRAPLIEEHTVPLTDIQVKSAKSKAKAYKLADERGLYLLVNPNGGKWWRLKYRIDGKEKLLSVGVYPDISLRAARNERDKLRTEVATGIDPSARRITEKEIRQENAANSFEAIAREWLHTIANSKTPEYTQRILRRMENDIFPAIGSTPITSIKPADVLKAVKKIEARGTRETAHRALSECGRAFRYAVASQRAERDVTSDLRGALQPVEGTHFAAVTEPKAAGELLRAIYDYNGSPQVCAALKIAPQVFVRPGELRGMEWEHINFETKEWRYLVTKTKTEHIVPLSTQVVAELKALQPLTGHGRFVFPSQRAGGRPMSDNAINAAFRRMGIAKDEMSGHGFRAMARTILDEVLGVRPDLIEHQLAHAVKDANGRAYNRTSHLPERRKMMQQWADYLERLRNGAEVIPIRTGAA